MQQRRVPEHAFPNRFLILHLTSDCDNTNASRCLSAEGATRGYGSCTQPHFRPLDEKLRSAIVPFFAQVHGKERSSAVRELCEKGNSCSWPFCQWLDGDHVQPQAYMKMLSQCYVAIVSQENTASLMVPIEVTK